MALPSLFNLDPQSFALGKGSGTLRRVSQNQPARQLDLAALMQDVAKPVQAVIKEQTPLTDEQKAAFEAVATPYNKAKAEAAQYYAQYKSLARAMGSYVPGSMGYTQVALAAQGAKRNYDRALAAQNKLQAEYDKAYAPIYEYNNLAKINQAEIDRYNKEVGVYNTEQGKRVNSFSNSLQNSAESLVMQRPNQQNTGEALAESDLYSDELYGMMLQRVGQANAEPVDDSVSSLYSASKGV